MEEFKWTEWITGEVEPPIGKRVVVMGLGGIPQAAFIEDEEMRKMMKMFCKPCWFFVLPPHPNPKILKPEFIG